MQVSSPLLEITSGTISLWKFDPMLHCMFESINGGMLELPCWDLTLEQYIQLQNQHPCVPFRYPYAGMTYLREGPTGRFW